MQRKSRNDSFEFGAYLAEYSDSGIVRVANLIGTVLASILPIAAIVVLYFVRDMGIRLGLVGVFSAVFSACLWFFNEGGARGSVLCYLDVRM